MNILLILVGTFAIGKIHGQEVINPQIINVQFFPPPIPLNSRAQSILIAPDPYWQFRAQTQTVQKPVHQAAYIDPLSIPEIDLSLPAPPVREDTLKKITPSQKIARMSLPTDGSPSNTSVGNSNQNPSDNIGRATLEENYVKPVSKKQITQAPEANQNSTTADEKFVLPPVKSVKVVNPVTNQTVIQPVDKNGTKVIVDERSSFDGDNCPTGQVRVNGKCVEKD